MSGELAKVKVFRFDPAIDKEPRYEIYKVPYEELNVLGVLHYIREHYDSTLAFRFGCEGYQPCKCGACLVLINGKPGLSCQIIAKKEMIIEPHPKYEIIKDLALDLNRPRRKVESKIVKKLKILVDNSKCNGCGDCVGVCPSQVLKIRGKKSFAYDIESCCGLSCSQCAQYCPQKAIEIRE
jgi:NAD-dependent dihydropyrimidine dehydrogenase PreA subunit